LASISKRIGELLRQPLLVVRGLDQREDQRQLRFGGHVSEQRLRPLTSFLEILVGHGGILGVGDTSANADASNELERVQLIFVDLWNRLLDQLDLAVDALLQRDPAVTILPPRPAT
jgi:hypothetical protein